MRVEGAFPVTMLPGDGVGPELMHAVKEVFKVSVAWGSQPAGTVRWVGKDLLDRDPEVFGSCP